MNYLPILLLFLLFAKSSGAIPGLNLAELISRLDWQSFAPLFKILGMSDEAINVLSSEKFAEDMQNLGSGKTDFKSLAPILASLFSAGRKNENGKKTADSENNSSSESADKTSSYFEPIKEIIPDDISESLSSYFS